MELGVKGRSFVLVGGTTGMGVSAARQLAADGANVALLARGEQRAAEGARLLSEEYGVRACGIGADAAAPQRWRHDRHHLLGPRAQDSHSALQRAEGGGTHQVEDPRQDIQA